MHRAERALEEPSLLLHLIMPYNEPAYSTVHCDKCYSSPQIIRHFSRLVLSRLLVSISMKCSFCFTVFSLCNTQSEHMSLTVIYMSKVEAHVHIKKKDEMFVI